MLRRMMSIGSSGGGAKSSGSGSGGGAKEDKEYVAAVEKAKKVKLPKDSTWHVDGHGRKINCGYELDPLFEYTTLVDIRWLVKLAKGEVRCKDETGKSLKKGVIPAWQQVPPEAVVRLEDMHAAKMCWSLPIGVLSYGWASRSHPDPNGEQLQTLLPLLQAIVDKCDHDQNKTKGEFPLVFGILWDYMALPQRGRTAGFDPNEDDRTPAEIARFRKGLSHINRWYGHPFVYTLVLNTPMPASAENQHPYDRRGWCVFERRVSGLIKKSNCFLEVAKLSGRRKDWASIVQECRTQRPTPMTPDVFENMLMDGVQCENDKTGSGIKFTSGKDLTEVVIPQYREAFMRLFSTAPVLQYEALNWHDDDIKAAMDTFMYFEAQGGRMTAQEMVWTGNKIGDTGLEAMAKWLANTNHKNLTWFFISTHGLTSKGAAAFAKAVQDTKAPIFELRVHMSETCQGKDTILAATKAKKITHHKIG